MVPLIPVLGLAVGGIAAAKAIWDAMSDDDETPESGNCVRRRKLAHKKGDRKARNRRAKVKEKCRQVDIREAEADLDRIRSRGKSRVDEAKAKFQRCRDKAEAVSSLAHDLDELLK